MTLDKVYRSNTHTHTPAADPPLGVSLVFVSLFFMLSSLLLWLGRLPRAGECCGEL